ncbi:MAG: hypothetical protein ABSG87_08370 [Verrucomicrobiota bacterium]
MKTWPVIGFSLMLNATFAAAILLSVKKSPLPAPTPVAATPVPAMIAQSPPPVEDATTPGLPFQWSQIASEDLKIYRDNLRAIGCPELTVREIIRAVINEDSSARRRDILTSFQDHYWDMVLNRELGKRQLLPQTEWGLALTSLAAERQQLISDVLGRDALTTEAERQAQQADWEQKYSWLSPEKRAQMIELEEKYRQHLDEWTATLASRADGTPTSEDEDNLQKLKQEFEKSEKQLLTPEELGELHLRESDVADWAANLPGFNPSEDEWRSLTELRSQFEESQNALADSDLSDEQRAVQQNELQSNFDNSIQGALDPDRFVQYQLANNDQYQALHNVTQRYGLPDSVAAQGLNVQQTAQAQADQVRANSNLSPEDQQSALNAIQHETEQTMGQILGANVLSTYKEYGGDWITGLSQLNQQ